MLNNQSGIIEDVPGFLDIFFAANCCEPGFFWLDSGNGEYIGEFPCEMGRFALLGMHPEQCLQYFSGTMLQIAGQPSVYCSPYESLQYLEDMAGQYVGFKQEFTADGCPIPFQAGLVGGFTYEFGYYLHDYFAGHVGESLLWEFSAYSAVLAVDLKLKRFHLVGWPDSQAFGLLGQKVYEAAQRSCKSFQSNFQTKHTELNFSWNLRPQYHFAEYQQKFLKVKDYLRQGEIYQLNLTQKLHLSAVLNGKSWAECLRDLYLYLRRRHPVPFGGFCRFSRGRSILSFSPECFFHLVGGKIEARPMKGTRLRGTHTKSDQRAYSELCHSPKERAELLMIADLLRNDLYHVCQPESVHVVAGRTESWPFRIEKYPSVWQQIAVVKGRLKPESNQRGLLGELWRALFPCGSIVGAPKIRAMALIRELEFGPRQWYTGNLGYIDGSGNMKFNVLIRSFYSIGKGELNYHVGGGLVWDSEPLAEWYELKAKCQFFLQALDLLLPDP